jgi:hypothetical protein
MRNGKKSPTAKAGAAVAPDTTVRSELGPMRLTTEAGADLEVTSRADLERALAGLGREGNGFAVLQRSASLFMQASANRPDAFVVEYRDGARLFRSERKDLSMSDVLALLGSYLESGEAPRDGIGWREVPELRTRDSRLSLDPGPQGDRTARQMVGLVAVGIVLAVVGIHLADRNRQCVERAVRTIGTVVSFEVTYSGERNEPAYWPIIHYVGPGARPTQFRGDRGSNTPEVRVGQKVLVLYDPERPNDARLAGPVSVWTEPIAVGVTGGLLALAGGGALLLRRLRARASREVPAGRSDRGTFQCR